MKMTIVSTDQITEINGVPARVWEGVTDSGVPLSCFVTRIAVDKDAGPEALQQFEAELQRHKPPTVERNAWPARTFVD